MATQEQLERDKLLQQAFSQFGGNTPAAPAAASEQNLPSAIPLPASTAQQPQAGPNLLPLPSAQDQQAGLMALEERQAQLRDVRSRQNEAQANSAKAITNRPRHKFLKEDQSFMDAFTDPSEAQRAFAFNAGLALLSSSGTNNLSQRIGQALGSGMEGMQKARQAEIDSAVKASQSKEAALASEASGIREEISFDDQRAAFKAAGLAAANDVLEKNYQRRLDFQSQGNIEETRRIDNVNRIADTTRKDRVRYEDRAIAKATREEKNKQEAINQAAIQSRFEDTELRLSAEKPSAELKTLNEIETLRANGETEKANYLQNYYNKKTALSTTTQTTVNGQPVYKTTQTIPKFTGEAGETPVNALELSKKLSAGDAKIINETREKFLVASQGDVAMSEFENLLDRGLETGGSFTRGKAALAAGTVDLMQATGLNLPFYSDEEEAQLADQVGMRESAISLSSQMGAERLSMFGGNDSERELLVALAMSPGVDKSIAGNRRIIKNSKIALQVLQSKANFMQKWAAENEGLHRVNKGGQSLANAWSKYQVSEFRKLGGDLNSAEIDDSSRKAGQSAVNVYRSRMGFDSGLSTDAYGNQPSAIESATGNPVLKSSVQDIINRSRN